MAAVNGNEISGFRRGAVEVFVFHVVAETSVSNYQPKTRNTQEERRCWWKTCLSWYCRVQLYQNHSSVGISAYSMFGFRRINYSILM